MEASASHSGLASSFTDLMTSLAVIFILLLCFAHNTAQEKSQETRESILDELREELKEFLVKGVRVEPDPRDPLAILVLVPSGLLEFEFDKATIPPRGYSFLETFIPRFSKIICDQRYRTEINSIVVEGHTDSSGTDAHNWELSQKRSMSVVSECLRILEHSGVTTSDNLNVRNYFVTLLSASGRGSAEPIIIDGAENREMSRRVILKIRVKSLEQRLVKTLTS